jgi:hypothetical protein
MYWLLGGVPKVVIVSNLACAQGSGAKAVPVVGRLPIPNLSFAPPVVPLRPITKNCASAALAEAVQGP